MPPTISRTCAFQERREAWCSATRGSTAVKSKFSDVDTSIAYGVAEPGTCCRILTRANSWLLCWTCLVKEAHCLTSSWTLLADGSATSTLRMI